jgi:hypothetical protein
MKRYRSAQARHRARGTVAPVSIVRPQSKNSMRLLRADAALARGAHPALRCACRCGGCEGGSRAIVFELLEGAAALPERYASMSNPKGRVVSGRSAVIAVLAVGFAFVACGGRSNLDPGQLFGGDSGIAGTRAGGGVGGTLGRGGTNGRGGSGGSSSGVGGVSVGGSDGVGGVGGVGGVSFGGSDGFGGSSGFGGGGLGGVAGSFGGVSGSVGACAQPPRYDCEWCHCNTCPAVWSRCQSDPGCAEISACIAATGCEGSPCYLEGPCRAVIDRHGGVGGPQMLAALQLQNCALDAGCSCQGGFGGSSGFGGAAGSEGISCDGAPDPCMGCICRTCNSELASCFIDSPCVNLWGCVTISNCYRFGTCERACAAELSAASEASVIRADNLVSCTLSSGCPCPFGAGGAAGIGGTAGFGGAAAIGGVGGSAPFDCENCYRSYCPSYGTCLTDESCSAGMDCAIENCYEEDWEPDCVAACFSGNPAYARPLYWTLQCVTTTCRPWCGTPDGP